jgi:hypothetical protein
MDKKINLIIIIAIAFGICAIALFMVIGPYLNRGEGDPYFVFTEVPVSEPMNSSVIHLEDKDIMNIRGLDVRQQNGKITGVIFKYSDTTPDISYRDFNDKYGSRLDDPSSRKYLEYKGVDYYATLEIP